jgi:adenosyl cobinamide kinase/adenosyl cobinamide phosphate guanylyltransferase
MPILIAAENPADPCALHAAWDDDANPPGCNRRPRHDTLVSPPLTGRAITTEPSHVTLVLGGARSGKSRHAEQLLTRHAAPWIYIATAQAFDDEMRLRIAEHQARRHEGWHTIEAPIDLPGVLDREMTRPVLIDCLTLWLTNLMLGGRDISGAIAALEAALDRRRAPAVLVSNEVGFGIVPETPLGRAFRDEAGLLNQRIAARAGRVLFMIAGLPLTLK